MEKNISCLRNLLKKKTGVVISGLETVYFKAIKLPGTDGMLHKGIRVNPARSQSSPKCVCSQNQAQKYMKHTLVELKGIIDKSTLIVGNFNTPLPGTDNTIFTLDYKVKLNSMLNSQDRSVANDS